VFLKPSSHFSSIDVTPSILRRCRIVGVECGTVWSGFGEGVCSRWFCGGCVSALCVLSVGQCGAGLGRECAAGGVWWVCVCVCCE